MTKWNYHCVPIYLLALNFFYGLTSAAVRRLAYQYSLKNKISMPASWTQNEMAGYDWLHSFLKRNTNISLRIPEFYKPCKNVQF